ncbi:MAG: ImmA/IrrE family metallo-endopeptidase, partial [Thermoleophilaceae bacterium]
SLLPLDARTIETAVTSAIEQRAERVLADVPGWIWDGDRLPVPVEHIADSCFGLHVRDVEDLRTAPGVPELPEARGLSGLLLPSLGEIWVNAAEARDWPPRRRFTIGHELGHWCLHRTAGAVWCRSHTVDPADATDAETSLRRAYPPEESEANEFAAALLMPAHLVRRHYERLRRRDPDGCFQQLCRIFGTSGAAMSRRLRRVV